MELFKRAFAAVVLAAGVVASNSVEAQSYRFPPQTGIWGNPAESGRGWSFEIQNDIVVISTYSYDTSGRATWFLSAGAWDPATGTVTQRLNSFSGGQCIGCTYVAPLATDLGQVRFEFTSPSSGRAIYPNGSVIPITRVQFGHATPLGLLGGVWATAWLGSSGNTFALFPWFKRNSPTLANAVEGNLFDRSSPVVGGPLAGSPVYGMVISSVTGFFDYYFATIENDKFTGLACTRRSTDPAPSLSQCTGLLGGGRLYSHEGSRSLPGFTLAVTQSAEKSAAGERDSARWVDSGEMAASDQVLAMQQMLGDLLAKSGAGRDPTRDVEGLRMRLQQITNEQ